MGPEPEKPGAASGAGAGAGPGGGGRGVPGGGGGAERALRTLELLVDRAAFVAFLVVELLFYLFYIPLR